MAPAGDEYFECETLDKKYLCEECKKIVKNGMQCQACECNYHYRCANQSPLELSNWICLNCNDVGKPVSMDAVRLHDVERLNLLLLGENTAYKKLVRDMEKRLLEMQNKITQLADSVKEQKNNYQNRKSDENEDNTESILTTEATDQNIPSETNYSGEARRAPLMEINKNGNKDDVTVNKNTDTETSKIHNNQDNDQFIQVAHKKKKRQTTIFGTRNDSRMLQAAERKIWLFVGRLNQGTKADDVLKYLKNSYPNENFRCEPLETKGINSCFRLGANINLKSSLMDPEFWPTGTTVRRFLFRRQ